MIENNTICSHPGCSEDWDTACLHGPWCLEHSVLHKRANHSCGTLMHEALRSWMINVALPIVEAAEHFKAAMTISDLPIDRIEKEIFPARLKIMEPQKDLIGLVSKFMKDEGGDKVVDGVDTLIAGIRRILHHLTLALRDAFEGADMPVGLDDEAVWRWYKSYLESGSLEH